MKASFEDVQRWSGDFMRLGSGYPLLYYRGVPEDARLAPFTHLDGSPLFLTDDPDEAAGYGHVVTVVVRDVRLFELGSLVYRPDRAWQTDAKKAADIDLSKSFLEHLTTVLGEDRAEDLYYHIEGGSWSAIENETVQNWIRARGYAGFRCWEGDGETLAFYDPDDVMLVADDVMLTMDPERRPPPKRPPVSP